MKVEAWKWRQYSYPVLSLCMIMKNEARRLQRCLDSVRGLADEIIIVDTGSVDDSVSIARRNGACVICDLWRDDFAYSRNVGVQSARGNWVLILDPDELIDRAQHMAIRELTLSRDIVAFRFYTRNYSVDTMVQGFLPNTGDSVCGAGWPGYVPSLKTRLFKNGCGLYFKGCYHELVDYTLDPIKHKVSITGIPVHHYPHEICQSTVKEKMEFYLRLACKKVELDPVDDQAWWELGVTAAISGKANLAARAMQMSLRKGFTHPSRLFDLAGVLRKIGEKGLGDFAFEKALCMLFPNLTHIDVGKKPFSGLLPHFNKNNS